MKTYISTSHDIQANLCTAPTVKTSTQEILDKILGFLNEDMLTKHNEKSLIIGIMLEALASVIKSRSEEIGYDYQDYKERLSASKEEIKQVFEKKILGHRKIQETYLAFLEMIEEKDTLDIIIQRLWNDYFENLVYESMEKKELERVDLNLSDNFYRNSREELHEESAKQELRRTKSINICNNILDEWDTQTLKIVFENLENAQFVDLQNCHLNEVMKEKLKLIFENLKNLIEINLEENELADLDDESLQIIFGNLSNAKIVDL